MVSQTGKVPGNSIVVRGGVAGLGTNRGCVCTTGVEVVPMDVGEYIRLVLGLM